MGEILYKYLDDDGGLKMLTYKNLQFTNSENLNDPFDCHPGLIDFSKVPSEKTKVWSKNDIMIPRYRYLLDFSEFALPLNALNNW